jgi:endonuclease/exonuclease/phosphatase (EEP) superfamily protein YafD
LGTVALGVFLVLPLLLPPFGPLDIISNFWPHLAILLLLYCLLRARYRPLVAVFCGIASAIVLYVSVRSLDLASSAQNSPSGAMTASLTGNEELKENIANFLISQNADFVFLQEAKGIVQAMGGIEAVGHRLGPYYPYRSGCEVGRLCSTVLLSKHPFRSVRRPDVPPGYNRFVIVAQAVVDGRDVTLVGVHLSKPLAGGQQEQQLSSVSEIVKGLPRPLILAGDFNAAPWSTRLRRFLNLAGLEYSYGYHPSWPVWGRGVGLPIDHVIADGLRVVDAKVWPQSIGSNHLPIIVHMELL